MHEDLDFRLAQCEFAAYTEERENRFLAEAAEGLADLAAAEQE